VPTLSRVADGVAEPVIYLADDQAWGGFYRVHGARGPDQNLNAPGAFYAPLAGARLQAGPPVDAAGQPSLYAYGVVARLAMVAAALELERTDPALSGAASA
jgi:glutamate--cysteine ligase